MRTKTLVLLSSALAVVLAAAAPASAADNPLQPLTAVAKQIDAGLAAFLAGKPPAEAFAPWKGAMEADEEASARAKMKELGVASLKGFYLEYELHYVKGENVVYRVRAAIWATPQTVSLLDLSCEAQEEGSLPDPHIATDTGAAALKPFAETGKAFDAAIRGEGWKSIPMADLDAAKQLIGDVMPMEEAKKDLEKARAALAKAGEEIKALAPDRVVVKIDDQGALAFNAEGKTVGMLEGEFEPQEDGTLAFGIGGFEAMPEK